jgi:hypothetical protein
MGRALPRWQSDVSVQRETASEKMACYSYDAEALRSAELRRRRFRLGFGSAKVSKLLCNAYCTKCNMVPEVREPALEALKKRAAP